MLDLVAVREGGTVAQALQIALRTAQHAEKLGFARYWLAEHHNMPGIASSATAVLVGIPAGFVIGRFNFLSRMFNPLISLLRPVSPLAWLPIGLLVFKGANPAAIWTIFICSIWPMIINTAVGVQRVPQDYMNVARVLNLSEWKIATKILFPAVLPYMLTGVRLAVGTAWLVIVAAEMLTGGVGIGFWVWDEWNNLNVKNIIIAIFVIGIVGLVLEYALIKLATAFTFEEVKA